jgi:glycosyltransferase 2 family protein
VNTAPPQSPSGHKRLLLWGIRLAVLAAVVWGVHRSLLDGLRQLSHYQWHLDLAWLSVGGAVYLLALLPAALFWRQILNAMGQEAGIGETARAYYIGHLGKYVPGKALVVILRAGLIRSHRVDPVVAGTSVFVETFTMMAVGSVLSAVIIPFWFPERWPLIVAVVGLAVLLGLPTLPPVFRMVIRAVPFLRSNPVRRDSLMRLRAPTLFWGWVANVIGWLVAGASLWAVMRSLGGPTGNLAGLPLYTAAVAIATVGGFLSMIPAGLFVREVILVELLAGDFGASLALVGALVFRLVSLVSEVVISVILYMAGPRPAPMVSSPE